MNSRDAATQLLEEAKLVFERDLPSAAEARNWRLVVRRSQEVVELVLKAFIKSAGYEYPKVHDPSRLLDRICEEKSVDLSHADRERIQKASAALAEERAPAFYAERSYSAQEAEEARASVEFVFRTLSCLIGSSL